MTNPKGIDWWESLSAQQKEAVVLYHSRQSAREIAEIFGLASRNKIIAVRSRINEKRRLGKSLPHPCHPANIAVVVTPADVPTAPKKRDLHKSKEYIQKPQTETKEDARAERQRPLTVAKPIRCCEAGCEATAVPKLAFCHVHARLHYKPMTKQIEDLLAAFS